MDAKDFFQIIKVGLTHYESARCLDDESDVIRILDNATPERRAAAFAVLKGGPKALFVHPERFEFDESGYPSRYQLESYGPGFYQLDEIPHDIRLKPEFLEKR